MFNRIGRIYILLILLLIWFYPAFGIGNSIKTIKTDTSWVKPYVVSNYLFDKYYSNKNFKYDVKSVVDPSLGNMFWMKLLKFLQPIFSSGISKIIIYIVFIFLFILFIIILSGADFQAIIQRNRNISANNFSPVEIEEENIDEKIQQALLNSNYAEAIRLNYIYILSKLNTYRLIDWHKEKTNRDYKQELSNTVYFENFSNLTRIYEYSWYGKFPVTRSEYDIFKKEHDVLKYLMNAR